MVTTTAIKDLLEKTDWEKYGVVDGVARDKRCENCMVHCGYEPTAALGRCAKPGDTWKNITLQLWSPSLRTRMEGAKVNAFNGVSAGNWPQDGHVRRSRNLRRRWEAVRPAAKVLPFEIARRCPPCRPRSRWRNPSPARRAICSACKSPMATGKANSWSIARSARITCSTCTGWGEVDEDAARPNVWPIFASGNWPTAAGIFSSAARARSTPR